VADFESSIFLDPPLWKVIKRAADLIPLSSLDAVDQRLIQDTLLNFRHEGADLSAADYLRVQQINLESFKASQRFRDIGLASRGVFFFQFFVENEADLAGIPTAAVSSAKESAAAKGQPDKWRFTLDFPSPWAVLRFVDSEQLRREI
jgi:oligopeptidase A